MKKVTVVLLAVVAMFLCFCDTAVSLDGSRDDGVGGGSGSSSGGGNSGEH